MDFGIEPNLEDIKKRSINAFKKLVIVKGLRALGISVEIVPARHQMLTFSKRSYQDFKTLINVNFSLFFCDKKR